ncbi:MAG: twin-arginine translocase subunit TatC [Planctomycetes bacterium]|nr:twin-arginine translocase subunit TatC [Planctomycetota bacterium]
MSTEPENPPESTEPPDPEDMFADTRMSLGDHIDDLRSHLLRALQGFLIGMVLGFWPLGPYVLRFILAPVEGQLLEFEKRKIDSELAEANAKIRQSGIVLPSIYQDTEFNKDDLLEGLGLKKKRVRVLDKMTLGFEKLLLDLDMHAALDEEARAQSSMIRVRSRITDPMAVTQSMLRMQAEVRRPRLTTLHITEAFMVYFKIALYTGLVISSPWVFYHIWMFIAAGLYPHEKRLVNIYLPFSVFLFIAGVVICQWMVMPKAVEAMLWFNEWLGLSADLRLEEWLGFALMMPIVFGASFQTPLVMMFLHRVGIVTVATFRDYRRISWFLMAIFAAVITPSVDALSMLFLWVPMCGLYELGILLCAWQGEQNTLFDWEEDESTEKSDELVEV